MTAKLLNTTEIDIDAIDTIGRLRPFSETAVISLMASIEEIGLQAEIHVRKVRHQGGKLRLIAGGHRIEAFRRMKRQKIPCKVWECTDDWATLSEIDDNLAHADLGALDLSVFLAERKAVYERMYPEAKNGGARGNQYTGGRQNDVLSFCQSVAENRDLSRRQIERLVAAGQGLDRATVEQLRAAPRRVSLSDLQILAKCAVDERRTICEALASGTAKSAAEALKSKSLDSRPGGPAQDPADIEAARIADAFARASKEGKRRFVRAHSAMLLELLNVALADPSDAVPFRHNRGAV